MGQGPGGWEKFRVVVARPSRMGRVGVRARHTFTRQGNKHPTRKQASDKETGTQQGSKHSTKKQALNQETSTQQGNKHPTSKKALIPRHVPLFFLMLQVKCVCMHIPEQDTVWCSPKQDISSGAMAQKSYKKHLKKTLKKHIKTTISRVH